MEIPRHDDGYKRLILLVDKTNPSDEESQRLLFPVFAVSTRENRKFLLNAMKSVGKSNKWVPRQFRYLP